MKSNDWRHKNVAQYTPRNTKILYFFNCLLDGMHTIIWFVASYYFILQPEYIVPSTDMHQENTPFVSDGENSYLEEQKDGTYIFHYGKYEEKVLKEDVENGIYEEYPIIKYNKK